MSRSWRDVAAPIIAKILADTAGKPEAEIKRAIVDAYPFGERQYHPYKIWLDEVRRQRKTAATKADLVQRELESLGQQTLGARPVTARVLRGEPADYCECGDMKIRHTPDGYCRVRGCNCKKVRPMRVWRWKEEK